jgi:quinol monooxygenase YgiN
VAKPELRADVIRLALAVAEPSRAEAGCLAYDFHERADAENEFLFFEEWADQAALDFHFQTPHFQNFIKQFSAALAAPPSIRVYEVGESRDLDL